MELNKDDLTRSLAATDRLDPSEYSVQNPLRGEAASYLLSIAGVARSYGFDGIGQAFKTKFDAAAKSSGECDLSLLGKLDEMVQRNNQRSGGDLEGRTYRQTYEIIESTHRLLEARWKERNAYGPSISELRSGIGHEAFLARYSLRCNVVRGVGPELETDRFLEVSGVHRWSDEQVFNRIEESSFAELYQNCKVAWEAWPPHSQFRRIQDMLEGTEGDQLAQYEFVKAFAAMARA
jgi:hypothetical protein